MSSITGQSKNKLHSLLFLLKIGRSLCWKQRFYRQETVGLEPRIGASWNWFVFLDSLKKSITLIVSVLCLMLKISVFRQRRTIRRQISAVCMLRTAFLLNLFAYIEGCDLSCSTLVITSQHLSFFGGFGTWWIIPKRSLNSKLISFDCWAD